MLYKTKLDGDSKKIQLGLSTFSTKQSPDCFEKNKSKLFRRPRWDNLKRKKALEMANNPDCYKTYAKTVFCPGETKWFVMFCTLTMFQKRLSLQWDHLNPIVAQPDNVLKKKRNNVVSNCCSSSIFSYWV